MGSDLREVTGQDGLAFVPIRKLQRAEQGRLPIQSQQPVPSRQPLGVRVRGSGSWTRLQSAARLWAGHHPGCPTLSRPPPWRLWRDRQSLEAGTKEAQPSAIVSVSLQGTSNWEDGTNTCAIRMKPEKAGPVRSSCCRTGCEDTSTVLVGWTCGSAGAEAHGTW